MEPTTLQYIIDTLETDNHPVAPYFGIFTHDGENTDADIRANPQGLKLFAAAVLRAAAALETKPDEPATIVLHGPWVAGNVYLDTVYHDHAPAITGITPIVPGHNNARIIAFIIVLLILATVFITGLVTVVQWAMQWLF
jgi:hypothetical protein